MRNPNFDAGSNTLSVPVPIPEDEEPAIAYVLEALDIHIVPLRIQFGDRSFLDKVGLTGGQFFEKLASTETRPRTSQPAPGDYRRMLEFLAAHYDAVIAISVTARVSGTWQTAVNAAARVDPVNVEDCSSPLI